MLTMPRSTPCPSQTSTWPGSITSVTTPRYEIGFQAAHLMLRQLNGEPLERRALDLGFKLAARDSA